MRLPTGRRYSTWLHGALTITCSLTPARQRSLLLTSVRRKVGMHDPIHISGMVVERVSSFKLLGNNISEDLTWTTNTSCLVKKSHQRLFFLRTLKKNHLSPAILVNFYRCAIKSILTNCITVCMGTSLLLTARYCKGWWKPPNASQGHHFLPLRTSIETLSTLSSQHF